MQEELLSLMAATNGHFQFESGHHGDLWLDLNPLFLRPSRLQRLNAELAARLTRHKIEAVCGPLVGGAFLAQTVASLLDVEFYYAERLAPQEGDVLYSVKYRIPNGLRERLQGKAVAVIDDVINAGSAVRATMADLLACGANPIIIGALLVLGSSAASFAESKGIPLECITHLPSNLWTPSECPLCVSGTPLEAEPPG